jgi:hypothetical protein
MKRIYKPNDFKPGDYMLGYYDSLKTKMMWRLINIKDNYYTGILLSSTRKGESIGSKESWRFGFENPNWNKYYKLTVDEAMLEEL